MKNHGVHAELFAGYGEAVFVATFAVELEPEARIATFPGQDPLPRTERRIMSDMLPVTASENRAPMALIILFETCDSLSQTRSWTISARTGRSSRSYASARLS